MLQLPQLRLEHFLGHDGHMDFLLRLALMRHELAVAIHLQQVDLPTDRAGDNECGCSGKRCEAMLNVRDRIDARIDARYAAYKIQSSKTKCRIRVRGTTSRCIIRFIIDPACPCGQIVPAFARFRQPRDVERSA